MSYNHKIFILAILKLNMSKAKSSQTNENILDKHIQLSVQQLLTYSAFLLTVGASIYTFFKAIPKLDELDESVSKLKESNDRVEERIVALRDIMDIKSTFPISNTTFRSNK